MSLRKYPSIDQFRHVVAAVTHRAQFVGLDEAGTPVYDRTMPLPTLTFLGTVKLHGTNAGVGFDLVGPQPSWAQSRERVLTLEEDNHGFCAWTQTRGAVPLAALKQAIKMAIQAQGLIGVTGCCAYGEWVGKSVNGKTAIGKLNERWVLFGVRVFFQGEEEEAWLSLPAVQQAWHSFSSTDSELAFICDFPQFSIEVDFNSPEASLAELERLTLSVEDCCPVAAQLGELGLGEGIVWSLTSTKFGHLVFKTKGDKHKGTKNARIVQVAPEVLANIGSFTKAVLTESRLEQGYDLLKVKHGKVTLDQVGDFLMWVGQDVLKEELDTLKASGLDRKQALGSVNRAAKAWLMPRLAMV